MNIVSASGVSRLSQTTEWEKEQEQRKKEIRELLPEKDISIISDIYGEEILGSNYISVWDYQPLLESFGYEIVVKIDDDDYQGDSRILFKDGDAYGVLIFGWGSCSGCDALQECDSVEDIAKLRYDLLNKIHWEDGSKEMLDYMLSKDWTLEWDYWNIEKIVEFISLSITKLAKNVIS